MSRSLSVMETQLLSKGKSEKLFVLFVFVLLPDEPNDFFSFFFFRFSL